MASDARADRAAHRDGDCAVDIPGLSGFLCSGSAMAVSAERAQNMVL
jgi:hypothetical protein